MQTGCRRRFSDWNETAFFILHDRIYALGGYLPRLKEFSSNKDQNVRNLYGERIQLLHNDPNIERIQMSLKITPKFIQLQTIEPGKLSSMLHFPGDTLLLIDVRHRSEFVKAHIKCKNIICIDPASFKDSFYRPTN
ncbi:CPS_collapsed_G0016850.mRNA.1.CDS.1 [Saccharomyces cerevisiae]|nr:CPS_collapsed_G0016850.mRNA.1.CDS.1 [Saccharomyces cerevisiae]